APRLTYRVRRDRNTDTPLPPDEPAGENPPDGAIIDYWLGRAPTGPVTLEILDATGKLVRRFSSADSAPPVDTTAIPIPTYWLRPPRIPSAEQGMHRFVWDLTYPAPEAFSYGYPISAIAHDTPRVPQGALVLPGRYTVRLTVAGQSYERPLVIRMDPRIRTPLAGLREQFALATRITDAMHRSFQGAMEVRALRAKLDTARGGAGDELAKEIERVSAQAAAIERGRGEGDGAASSSPGLVRLNGQLASLLESVEESDAAPTPAMAAAVADLERALGEQLARWTALRSGGVRALDARLRAEGKAGLGN
ncbi:MAG TPA: hypothetical protein VFS44_14265, partial [Gemmatimonadaceae bacterium]|nr:hypothetical protein [Gemmatimonadaceae bacterium]